MQPANMTGLAQPPPVGRLRHQDPPRLWRNIVAGSVGMHLLLLLALPSILQPVDSQSQAGMQAPTPIELIDLAQVGINSQAAGEGAAATDAPNPEAPAANVPATAQTTQTAPPSAFAPPGLAGDRTAPPSAAPNPPPLPSPDPPPDPANPAEQTASPDTASADTGLPLLVGDPLPDPPYLYPGNLAEENSGLGGVSAGGDNPNADGNIPSRVTPTSLTGTVVGVRSLPLDETADIPEQSAAPVTNSFLGSVDPTQPGACELTPNSVIFFGETVETVAMQVTVELDGRVSKTQIRQSSVSTEYDNLASCLVEQNLRFTPASTDGIETPSDNLVVSITVDDSN